MVGKMERFKEVEYISTDELKEMDKEGLLDLAILSDRQLSEIEQIIKDRIGDDLGMISLLPHPDKQIIREGYNIVRYLNNLLARIELLDTIESGQVGTMFIVSMCIGLIILYVADMTYNIGLFDLFVSLVKGLI